MTLEQSEQVPQELSVLVKISDDLIADIQKVGREIDRLEHEIRKLPPNVDVSFIMEYIDEIVRLFWDIESRAEEIRVEVA